MCYKCVTNVSQTLDTIDLQWKCHHEVVHEISINLMVNLWHKSRLTHLFWHIYFEQSFSIQNFNRKMSWILYPTCSSYVTALKKSACHRFCVSISLTFPTFQSVYAYIAYSHIQMIMCSLNSMCVFTLTHFVPSCSSYFHHSGCLNLRPWRFLSKSKYLP